MRLKKILVPVDFSDSAVAALRSAGSLAAQVGASLTALHVYEVPELIASSMVSAVGAAAEVLRQVEADYATSSRKRLEEFLAAHPITPATTPPAPIAVEVQRGTPWVQIVRLAEEGEFDLVVMGTRGHSELATFLLGSVASRVIRKAPCPVMTVRASTRTARE
jgi:nucleotide-binding universal stress UspA family protein